jgi:uncharacterized membrane protein YkvI
MLKPQVAAWWSPLWKRIAVLLIIPAALVGAIALVNVFLVVYGSVLLLRLFRLLFVTFPKPQRAAG